MEFIINYLKKLFVTSLATEATKAFVTVSDVLADFHAKVDQLQEVAKQQEQEVARQLEAIANAEKAKDKAEEERLRAKSAIGAIKSITDSIKVETMPLADLKKEIK